MAKRYERIAMVGAAFSRTGDDMAGPAMLLFAFGASKALGGAALFGALSIAAAVGGPALGIWLDRARTGRPLAVCLALFGAGLAASAVALHAQATGLSIGLALAAGLFGPAVAGGWSACLTSNDPGDARRLAAFDASSYSLAGLIGPALAALAYAIWGSTAPLALTLVLLAIGAAVAPWARPTCERPSIRAHPITDLAGGARAITRNRPLRAATLSSCVTFVGVGLVTVAIPQLGAVRFGSPGVGALLLAVMAAAALLANAVLARRDALRRPARVLVGATLIASVGVLTLAAPWPVAAVLGAAIIGFGDGPQLAALIQLRHTHAPAGLRTQVFTTGASLKITAVGVGAFAAGPIGQFGLPALFIAAAALHLGGAVIARGALNDARR